jgi:hypothetical protein
MNKESSDKQINQMHITIVTDTKKKTKSFSSRIKNVIKRLRGFLKY